MVPQFRGNFAVVVADSSSAIVNTVGSLAFLVVARSRLAGCLVAGALLVCALSFGPSSASAQPYGEVVVVPVEVGEGDSRAGAAHTRADEPSASSEVETGLVDENVTLISQHDARDRFVARSRPPQVPTGSDVEALARAAREALEHVAYGRTAAARKSVQQVIALAERTLESLNRETATARNVLNACLSLVRGSLQEHKREAALAQAMQCRRLVPDLTPSEATHPANVVGVLAEADNLLRRMRLGSLQVQSFPDERCSVYVNGRHLGTTPFKLDRAATGEYRIQVECGSLAGRVHVVQLGDAPVRLVVDTAFDRVVESARRLALHYDSLPEARALSTAHAAALGAQIGASDVILVAPEGDKVVLSRIEVEQKRLLARAVVPARPRATPAVYQRALVALAEGRIEPDNQPLAGSSPAPLVTASPAPSDPAVPASAPATQPAGAPTVSEEPAPAPAPRALPEDARASTARRNLALRVSGITAFGLGATATIMGAIYTVRHGNDGRALRRVALESDDYEPYRAAWRSSRKRPFQLAIPGAAVASIGAALLVAGDADIPIWLASVSGAAALGMLTWGAVELANGETCSDTQSDQLQCSEGRDRAHRGSILMISAAPLVVLPVALLVRTWFRSAPDATSSSAKWRVTPSLQAQRGAVGLSLDGSWL
jgi:hypothetical protein